MVIVDFGQQFDMNQVYICSVNKQFDNACNVVYICSMNRGM
jgi:hypothetical protein